MKTNAYRCPRCGHKIRISSRTDWDSLVTYWYPLCPNCKLSTRDVYPSEAMALEAAKDLSKRTDKEKPQS